MKRRTSTSVHSAKSTISVGQDAYLDRDTSFGLFGACNGNRYLITQDFDRKVAIALSHSSLPPFTWQFLNETPLEYGKWLGGYRLQLTHTVPDTQDIGIMQIGDRCSGLQCVGLGGHPNSINLGHVGRRGWDMVDYDGWSLLTEVTREVFFVREPTANAELMLRPRHKGRWAEKVQLA